jgi:hypothetical protein
VSSVECGGCMRAYPRESWTKLPLVRTLTIRELERYVVGWKEARVIEVRACACGRPMARATSFAEVRAGS